MNTKNDTENYRTISVRIRKPLWKFLKRASMDQERTIGNIVQVCLESYKNRLENKLTDDHQDV